LVTPEPENVTNVVVSDIPNTAETWHERGLALAEEKKFSEAIECFRQALSLRPNYLIAELNLGMCYKNLGYLEEAARIFRNCIDTYPGDPAPLIQLGRDL
jgi:protein O-GlcNAc transferase